MYDPTIHAKTLARHVRKSDFEADESLLNRAVLDAAVRRAVGLGLNGFSGIKLRRSSLAGKEIYQLSDIAESLVVRHITSHIRHVTGVKQDNREFIVTCIQNMLSEGTSFRVYKFDIASFYESVSVQKILEQMESDIAFSGQSIRALRSLFIQLAAAEVVGLPRGMPVSATLAEYLLKDFDKLMSNISGVWFYARFVDDIVIITDGRENPRDFTMFAGDSLPTGLHFNKKSKHYDLSKYDRSSTNFEEECFDFLGYNISVSWAYRNKQDNKISRDVWLDIAPSKVRKIKTRISRSLLAYSHNHNFNLLLDRLRLLTSNFKFLDLRTGVRRTSGIYFNYPLVTTQRSRSLPELDCYLLRTLTSPHPKNILRPSLTPHERQQLLNLRFQDGFVNKRFFSFSSSRLSELTRCWAYA